MKRLFVALVMMLLATSVVAGGEPVRLVVNIVLSGVSEVDLERYEAGFKAGGFKRLLEGEHYDNAFYPFAPTKESALATLSTGALPALHGVVGAGWWNYTSGAYTSVVGDGSYSTFGADTSESRVSNSNLVLETISDVVVRGSSEARSVSVAADPSSAIILGGLNPTEVWWLDSLSGRWTTSTKYKTSLPKWLTKYNSSGWWRSQMGTPWVLSRPDKEYINSEIVVAKPYGYKPPRGEKSVRPTAADIKALMYSHISNSMVADAAKEAIIYNRLGGDKELDVLNVCFDSPRRIIERYGLHSREVEDMYYRLDENLADFLTFASAQAGGKILFVLTTDGSMREVTDAGKVFNVSQARFLINSFLSATYGKGDWVLGCADGGVWLNHTLLFSRGLDVASVQRQVGTFCLGMRGLSHAIIASDMMSGDVKEGMVEIVQQGFYPKRSADIHFVLMPGWCYSEGDYAPKVSSSLPYAPYRKAVMAISGMGVEGRCVKERVDVRELVAVLAERLGIELPLGADA